MFANPDGTYDDDITDAAETTADRERREEIEAADRAMRARDGERWHC